MTSRRFDDAPRAIARLQRRLDDLWKLASRKGHGHDSLPLGVLGYAEVTSDQTGISTTTDLTGLSVAVTAAPSRRLRITGQVLIRQQTSAGQAFVSIREGSTELNRSGTFSLDVGDLTTTTGSAIITPSSGAHTYNLTLKTNSGTVDALAFTGRPNFILVEDIGPA